MAESKKLFRIIIWTVAAVTLVICTNTSVNVGDVNDAIRSENSQLIFAHVVSENELI